ncbi:DNA ligase (NAD(+)) LigA, partial [Leptospira interrogans serovar Pomona]|nr:DNA ligase (NAD(+)) LigA [Leptospira interrogans serovar Pomona]
MSKKKQTYQNTLSEKEAKKVIAQLTDEIRHHQYLYYVKNQPEISDFDFDQLFKRLRDLEEEFPQFKDLNSPTLVVGSDLDKDFEKFQHKLPVLSLINTYNDDELLDWVNKTDP